MDTPELAERPEKIDYNKEYLERFERAKQEAEARGLKYHYPSRAGKGWKIHLGISDNSQDPLTQEVAKFVHAKRFLYKIGEGGTTEEGKGMTIYIGDRDTTENLAVELDAKFGEKLPPAKPQVKHDDVQIEGNVWARFEVANYPTPHGRMNQYGYKGVGFLPGDLSRVIDGWHDSKDRLTWIQAWTRADMVMKEEFGAFYTGTKTK